jgi:hypothetical protein
MAVGIALAITNWILLAVVSVLFVVVYHYIILDEEIKLRRIFGQPYEVYTSLVPRFFPLLPARASKLTEVNPEISHHSFSWSLAMKNKAYEAYATFAGLVAFVVVVAWLWQR